VRASRVPALAVVLVALAGCQRCSKAPEAKRAGVEAVLPRNAVAVVVVPSLRELGARLKLLEQVKVAGFVAGLQGFPSTTAFADALVGQLGVDVRSPEALEKAGLDASRGLGAAVLLTGKSYLVLPVKDPAALRARLEGLSANRLGAGASGEQVVGTVTVNTFSRQQGQPARLGFVVSKGWAFVAVDEAISALPQAATLTPLDTLDADVDLTAALARPAQRDVYAWFPSGSVALGGQPWLNALVTASLSSSALDVRVAGKWKGSPEVLQALASQPAVDLSKALPADAFLSARYTGDAKGLSAVAKDLLGPAISRAFEEGGLDVKREVLEQVQPGTVLSLSLAERPPMDKGMPAFDIRQTNPFAYAHLSGLAPVASGDTVMPTLEKVAALAPRFGAKIEKQQREGRDVFFTTWAQGQGVHFGPKGSAVAFAAPIQRLDAVLAAPVPGAVLNAPVPGAVLAAPVPGAVLAASDAKAAASSGALVVNADLVKLAASVRALPESAWGLGGFALKPTTLRWLDATDDLKAVRLVLSAQDGQVEAQVSLSLALPRAPEAKRP